MSPETWAAVNTWLLVVGGPVGVVACLAAWIVNKTTSKRGTAMRIGNKAKAIVGGVALVVTALSGALADNVFDLTEGQHLATVLIEAVVGIYAVWRVRPARGIDTPKV